MHLPTSTSSTSRAGTAASASPGWSSRGETLRYHLVSGYIDWFLRESLLAVPKGLKTLVRDHDMVAKLEDRFNTLEGEAGSLDVDDDVQDFLGHHRGGDE